MSNNTPIIQAYVFKANQDRSAPALFNGVYEDVRNWLIDRVLEPEYSTLRVHTGENQEFSWSVKQFLELTDPRVQYFSQTGEVVSRETVNHPSHYNKGKFEVIEVIEDWKLGFNLGNAIKYIGRAGHKGSVVEDLKKALWYLNREIRNLEGALEAPRLETEITWSLVGGFDKNEYHLAGVELGRIEQEQLLRLIREAREVGNIGISMELKPKESNLWLDKNHPGKIWLKEERSVR